MIVHHTETTTPKIVFHADDGQFYPQLCAAGTSLRFIGAGESKVLTEIRICAHGDADVFADRYKEGDCFLVEVLFHSGGPPVNATCLCVSQKLINEHRSFVLKVLRYC